MVEIEITHDLTLSTEQTSLLQMHSFLNVLSVLDGVVYLLGEKLTDDAGLESASAAITTVIDDLENAERALDHAREVDALEATVMGAIEATLKANDGAAQSAEVCELVAVARTVFEVIHVRVRELLARQQQPDEWLVHSIAQLDQNFRDFLAAVEQNARGRYRIVNNIAAAEPTDYVVHLDIESVDGETITMPGILQDVLRDLLANARKYTEPGGEITAGLFDDGHKLRLVVEDKGLGIPEEEIEQVVDYGHRAQNALNKPTMGDGFGLTKAYFVTRQFGGRMWIASQPDVGTRVRIEIEH